MIQIRRATATVVSASAHFNQALALESEHRVLDPPTVQAGVAQLLARPELGFYLEATASDQPVGCLLITTEWSDWRNGLFWWIQSVYVQPAYRRQGIFRRLYQTVNELAQAQGEVCGLRLYVEQDNRAAQNTYRNLGMAPTAYQVYETLDLESLPTPSPIQEYDKT